MARLLTDFDGPSLNNLYDLIVRTEPQQILSLFHDDCSRKINESISLLELARFRTLLNERQGSIKVNKLIKKSNIILNLLTHCRMM
ncbi:unnamed protein product [Rotaria sp. Silwood1]|nr:unnamed protein product [Rotaria sp. Silwood1]